MEEKEKKDGAPPENGEGRPVEEEAPVRSPEEKEGAGPGPEQGAATETVDWKAKAEENWNLYLRARADFENYQKRMQRHLTAEIRQGKKRVFLDLLEVMDNFERALAQKDQESGALLAGIEIIYRQLETLLAKQGVKAFSAVGQPFDPIYHEAVAVWEKEDIQEEVVTDEIQRGYFYEGEVLRPARVRVARPKGQ